MIEHPLGVECTNGCSGAHGNVFHPANRPHDTGLDGRRHADTPPPPKEPA